MIDNNTKKVLKKLIEILNANNITWGVGGSFLLQLYGLYETPQDLDLWVKPTDMKKIRDIFKDYPEIESDIPLPAEYHFKTKFHSLEVDFVACFIRKPNQNTYIFQIEPNNIHNVKISDDLEIPCTFLEDWFIIYKLLKRENKAQIIKSFFSNNKLNFDKQVLKKSISNKRNNLPQYLLKEIPELVETATQYYMKGFSQS